MPAALRPKGKATKIFHGIMGIPPQQEGYFKSPGKPRNIDQDRREFESYRATQGHLNNGTNLYV